MNTPLSFPLLSQIDGLIRAMLVMVVLTLFFPALGASDGPLRLNIVTIVDVSLVSSLHDAALFREKIVEGARSQRLHLFVQSYTFTLFPLIGAVILFAYEPFIPVKLLLGMFYLCTLPSTASPSVAMAAMTRGNVPAAIFDTIISGLAGMITIPLLMSFVIQAPGANLSMGKALLGVAERLPLPFVLGRLLRPVLGGFINKREVIINKVNRVVTLLVVFNLFADSAYAGVWPKYPWETIVAVTVVSSALLFIALGATTWLSRHVGFNLANEITAVFCGSKRSLASGVPIGKILFTSSSALGLIVLPLMICHQLQLVVCLALAHKYIDRVVRAESSPATPASHVA